MNVFGPSGAGRAPMVAAVALCAAASAASAVLIVGGSVRAATVAALASAAPCAAVAWWWSARWLRAARALADAAERSARTASGRLPLPEVGHGAAMDRFAAAFNTLAARLDAAVTERERFTSDASHELRTPLTALRAVGAVALQAERDPQAWRQALGEMLEIAGRMNRLIDQLLLLARSDADAPPAQLADIDVAALLTETAEALRVLADERGLRLVVAAPPGLVLRADAEWLRLALVNLVQNAIRHSPTGGTVTLSAQRRGYEGTLEVADEGPGIAPEHHERIFERFYRVDPGRTRAEGGVGLGLAIAKWAVERCGGSIGLHSAPGAGAAFWIRLTAPGEPAVASPADNSNAPAAPLDPLRQFTRPAHFADLREAAQLPLAETLARLDTDGCGLTATEASVRRRRHGPNRSSGAAPPSRAELLWRAFRTPFNALLGGLAAVSLVTADYAATATMAAIVALGTALRAHQERRSWLRASDRDGGDRPHVTALRRPSPAEAAIGTAVLAADLVPGDVVLLRPGDTVPADVRVLEARSFFVSQSALNGEPSPVEKHPVAAVGAHGAAAGGAPLLALPNLVCAGATVVAGQARALVIATGKRALSGGLSGALDGARGPTAFDAGVNRVSWLLIRYIAAMLAVAFLLHGLVRGEWGGTFFYALAVAVGLTPELLPLIVNANLARGAAALARRGTLVKRLAAVHDLGAVEVFCTDKTGTLTLGTATDPRALDPAGQSSERIADLAQRIGLFRDEATPSPAPPEHVAERPFDPLRRIGAVVLRTPTGAHLAVAHGAPRAVLQRCYAFDELACQRLLARAAAWEDEGARVVALATRELPAGTPLPRDWTEGLTFAGWVVRRDPVKPEAAATLARLRELGVETKILTGSSARSARALASELGLDASRPILDGDRIDALDDEELHTHARAATICAQLTPPQKARLVRVLRRGGQVVGFLGDGINDVPALRAADVGVAVAGGATVAREAADAVMLANDLASLATAIVEGRRVHGNIAKYVKAAASSNFGNALAVLGAGAFLPFLPMLPVQLLVQNLLYGAAQLAIPWDRVDPEHWARPRRWVAGDLGRFMLCFGPLSTLFDWATFALLWWTIGAATAGEAAMFQGGWFVLGLLSQTLVVHVIRTARVPLWESTAAPPVLAASALAGVLGLWLPFSPFAGSLGLAAPPTAFWLHLPLCLIAYLALVQTVKTLYRKRTGEWL